MGFRMKILILWGFIEKSDGQGGGVSKNQYREGNCRKRGSWTVYRFKGRGLGKKEGGGALRGGVGQPMHTMLLIANI